MSIQCALALSLSGRANHHSGDDCASGCPARDVSRLCLSYQKFRRLNCNHTFIPPPYCLILPKGSPRKFQPKLSNVWQMAVQYLRCLRQAAIQAINLIVCREFTESRRRTSSVCNEYSTISI